MHIKVERGLEGIHFSVSFFDWLLSTAYLAGVLLGAGGLLTRSYNAL